MNRGTILLVEDDSNHELLIRRALKGHIALKELVSVRDGAEALKYIFSANGKGPLNGSRLPTLILLDIKLPRIDGLEVLRCLRANARTRLLPVVMLTSSNEEKDLLAAYNFGANSFIRKPVSYSKFSQCIKEICSYWLVFNELPPETLVSHTKGEKL